MSVTETQDLLGIMRRSRRNVLDNRRKNRRIFSYINRVINDDITSLTRPQLFYIRDLLIKPNKPDDERGFCKLLPDEVKRMAISIEETPLPFSPSVEELLFEEHQKNNGQFAMPNCGPYRVLEK